MTHVSCDSLRFILVVCILHVLRILVFFLLLNV